MIVGLTGGIGSGKTTIAKVFEGFGIPVFLSDNQAHKIVESDKEVIGQIKALFGEVAYTQGKYNRKYIAEIVFKDKGLLSKLNAIVHPAVARHFQDWKANQKAPYVLIESAILFESGLYRHCDSIIAIEAPEQERIERVIQREGCTREWVESRIKNQWSDSQRRALSDFIILNKNISEATLKAKEIHHNLMKKVQ
ncbi:Dephospho-CoA kinase [Capnocytophaga canimorsus]|uniref:Dephospho-CoA kinase n=1 Tax=Capnocytophaga canimorsus TaxID=28188 RepID=A0A0B7H0V1_9FLAO|nr:dephospho-CoA kinase [Capnocytophaga canimorsus]ATA77951.1 dephospho-CoA kinase [Capnocytophaga canimorsus]PJI80249.1 dephospho-CoA kinase [Capnocytophaga canimorsus]WGU71265.1 dephospho-CoA kinase [Capnocytophaga canimorsus]CEN33176.1 Dephospho-CoA kinase [Capnocytophaga canimorsus]STA73256.1 Dephospho-CoA kinase [Capnocytophaga canimorsus]